MPATVKIPPEPPLAKTRVATITSKGQITIPAQTRRELGVKPGDKLAFQSTPHGIVIVRQNEENRFEKYRGIGNGIPELDGDIDSIVRYMRELRGHDELDDHIFGTER